MLQGPRTNSRGMQQQFMGPGYMMPPTMWQRPMQQSPFGTRPMRTQGQFSPLMGRSPQSKKSGGLIGKLLGKGGRGNTNGMPGFLSPGQGSTRTASSGGGLLQTLTDPTAINGFLNNTQQVLKTAQQFGPMIQQYGPLVRNLPSMWKLYKGLKDLPDAEEQSEQETPEPQTKSKKSVKSTHHTISTDSEVDKSTPPKKPGPKGTSTPKLFI